MLILTVKPDQNIFIGSHITLKLTAIKGFQAKIGVDAPRDVPVVREELLRRPGGKGRPA